MAKKKADIDSRKYMEMAIEVMKKSIQEPREDKVSPQVGAVLIKKDGTEVTAFRGELRHGDHAEFTLIERKNRDSALDESILFATLEPCAPGAREIPKLSCAERITNARIKEVWIGIEDPDPTVAGKGFKHLKDNNIKIHMFPSDLQKEIREVNNQFIKEAEERAKHVKEEKEIVLSEKERIESNAVLDDLSKVSIQEFISSADLGVNLGTDKFNRIFAQLGFLKLENKKYHPTGIGLLLFGKRPQLTYPNAMIRATYKTKGKGEEPQNFEGPITSLSAQAIKWYEDKIGHQISRSTAKRKKVYDYPIEAIRESITNAVVHRDYDIDGAPIYFEINDNAIIIKSPGEPVEPIELDEIKRFSASSLSRNPKIMFAFDQLELVEQRGLGFQTIKELPTKHNLPLPIVTYEKPYMVFKFPRSGEALRNVSEQVGIESLSTDELIGYNWIRTQNEVATKDYAIEMKVTQRTASRHLAKMLDLKLIKTNDESSKSPKLRYLPID